MNDLSPINAFPVDVLNPRKEPERLLMLLFNPVIAPPDLFERFPSACVICKIFALTFGAFESVSNRYLRLSASKGIFVTARPLATLPSLDMAVTRLLILVISNSMHLSCSSGVQSFVTAQIKPADSLSPV